MFMSLSKEIAEFIEVTQPFTQATAGKARQFILFYLYFYAAGDH